MRIGIRPLRATSASACPAGHPGEFCGTRVDPRAENINFAPGSSSDGTKKQGRSAHWRIAVFYKIKYGLSDSSKELLGFPSVLAAILLGEGSCVQALIAFMEIRMNGFKSATIEVLGRILPGRIKNSIFRGQEFTFNVMGARSHE